MRVTTAIGGVMLVGIAAVIIVVAAGAVGPVALVSLVPLGMGAAAAFAIRRIFVTQDRDAARVQELGTRGVRRRGRVRDALPYASEHGGAVFTSGGAQMVLRVELEAEAGLAARVVTVQVVEPSETARGRIGTEVIVIEHPDDPGLRALEGHLPNGRRR